MSNISSIQTGSDAKPLVARLLDGWTLGLMGMALLWLVFFNELRAEWQINVQYNYGYVVPLLGLALLWRRWPERPTPVAPARTGLAGSVVGGLLVLALPVRMLIEGNPEWRLIYWINGFEVLGLSLCGIYLAGGWRWVRYFAPPLAFMLIAIPWPMAWEQGAVQGLMRFVAYLTVEISGWLNIPAVQHGNLVEVGAGVLGIDEACSGVRSLQSGLMVSLFLGELHRFSAFRRISLLAVSLVLVLFANVCRTTFLVWAAASRGLPQMEAWHNLAGTIVMVIVLTGLVLLAYLITPKSNAGTYKSPAVVGPWVTLPRWFGLALVICLAAAAAVTELWYRSHEKTLVANPSWSVAWPANSPDFKNSELPQKSLSILRCSDSQAASWRDDDGNSWSGFLLRWPAGRNSAQLAKGHTPEICLTAAGATKIDDFGPVTLQASGIALPFRHQTYENRGQIAHVFYCLWPERIAVGEKPVLEDGSRASRLEAVLAGKRHLGQQVLELTIAGPESRDAAVALLKDQLPKLISPLVSARASTK